MSSDKFEIFPQFARMKPPREILLKRLDETTIDDLRKLNAVLFPVKYAVSDESVVLIILVVVARSLALFFQLTLSLSLSQESFYRDCAAAGTCTSLAYVCSSSSDDDDDENGDEFEETHRSSSSSSSFDELAGAIAVRLEKHPKLSDKARMYIMTLGVYAPHRSRGIGSRLLTNSLNEASEDENIVDAYLHVQTNNDEAIKFYCDPNGKFAFEKGEVIEKYYKRIEPDSAVVLRLDMKKWKRKEVEKARCMEYHARAIR